VLVASGAALVAGAGILTALAFDAQASAETDAADRSLAVSVTIANDPYVHAALVGDDPTALLQPYAVGIMDATEVSFVTIMTPEGVRITHRDPQQIGRDFLGTIEAAQRGETITETFTGTLGPSVRAVVPILDDDEVIGIVSAGIITPTVGAAALDRMPFALGLTGLVLGVGLIAAVVSGRMAQRAAGPLSGPEIARMREFYRSVLYTVREGVVLTDGRGRVVLVNDEAAGMLGMPPGGGLVEATAPGDLGLDPDFADLVASGRRAVEEVRTVGDRELLVNQQPMDAGRGAVMTFRDRTELRELVGELEGMRAFAAALREQSHDYSNNLHTVLSLIELGRVDDAARLISDSATASQALADTVSDSADPIVAALLLGKVSEAAERGIELTVDLDGDAVLPLAPSDAVSLVGNLVDNALDAACDGDPPRRVVVRLRGVDGATVLEVADSGRPFGAEARRPGSSTKEGFARGVGMRLVADIVARADAELQLLDDPKVARVSFGGASSGGAS
jgi:two-component system CitB family sensor kinase